VWGALRESAIIITLIVIIIIITIIIIIIINNNNNITIIHVPDKLPANAFFLSGKPRLIAIAATSCRSLAPDKGADR
jgi:hypothetical protein